MDEMISWTKLQTSKAAKIVTLGVIWLILLMLIGLTCWKQSERQSRGYAVAEEISSKWGGQSYLCAPVLRIPATVANNNGDQAACVNVIPNSVKIECQVTPEIRQRSIYEVLLHRAKIKMTGSFKLPEFDKNVVKSVDLSKAELRFCFRSEKGITDITASIGNRHLTMKTPEQSIFSFDVVPAGGTMPSGEIPFTAEIELKGYQKIMFLPNADTFELEMKSAWPHPSFCGNDLPPQRDVTAEGFTAQWKIGATTIRQCPQYWTDALWKYIPFCKESLAEIDSQCVGVTLVKPADTYAQIERVTDYAFVLIAVLLIVFLCGELLTKIWVHPFQYFFVGLSMAAFYLLLLALAEHINFNLSYLISSLVISGMTTAYSKMIFAKKNGTAFVLGGIMLAGYAFIYFLTKLEDYALLMGTAVLLLILAILMAFTGNLNKGENKTEDESTPSQLKPWNE